MANVVLRSKLANKNIIVENKVLRLPIEEDVVELNIKAVEGFQVDASDFNVGYLPRTIQSITFSNSGENVIASVYVKKSMIDSKYKVIYLPISAKVKANAYNLQLTETINKDKDILTQYVSPFSTSIINNETTYNIRKNFDEKFLAFTRTFRLINGYRFSKTPSYTIEKNIDRYTIEEELISKDGKITGKTFKVYYKSPKDSLDLEAHENITFLAQSALAVEDAGEKVATKKEEYKIYSFDKGQKVGAQGGTRKITVKGVPGTPFKLMLQDSNKKTYNQKTGTYEAGGGMIQGVIPKAPPGVGFGTYLAVIKVPRTTTAVSYSDRLISDLPIDHKKIKSTADANTQLAGKAEIKEEKISPESKITISIDTTGSFTTNWTDLVIGPGDNGDSKEVERVYTLIIKPDDDSSISVDRQPLQDPEKAFTAWDSGDKADADTSAGVAIENDWYNTRVVTDSLEETSSVLIVSKAKKNDDSRNVEMKINIRRVTFGEGNNTYKLKLLNFLTQTSL